MAKAKKILRSFLSLSFLTIFLSCTTNVFSQDKATIEDNYFCSVYITGIGCHNCAVIDPVLLSQKTSEFPNLIIFEYEIYHSMLKNNEVKNAYFRNYVRKGSPGVPFLIFNKQKNYIGRFDCDKGMKLITGVSNNSCPMPDGSSTLFKDIDLTKLYGKANIWTKNRVLISGGGGENRILKELLTENDIRKVLKKVRHTKVKPIAVKISEGEIKFSHAVKIGDWLLQWNDLPGTETTDKEIAIPVGQSRPFIFVMTFLFIGLFLCVFAVERKNNKLSFGFKVSGKRKDWIIIVIALSLLMMFFFYAKNISPDFLKKAGYEMPLPVFTFLIGIIDGINPCNMFVLTCLLVLLVTTSHDKKRLYVVAFSFVFVVFVFYFLFMAAWLNIFKYITFITPLRIIIGLIALIAGLINCKELVFFKKGVSLTIPEKQKGPLLKRINRMKSVVINGSYPLLISSSIALAALSSLVEIPCTAGFPIIYTSILSAKDLENTWAYYGYLGLYNIFYVIPIIIIVFIFIFTFKAKYITQRQVEIMKFIGGVIMVLLGIILLVNPSLIGINIG